MAHHSDYSIPMPLKTHFSMRTKLGGPGVFGFLMHVYTEQSGLAWQSRNSSNDRLCNNKNCPSSLSAQPGLVFSTVCCMLNSPHFNNIENAERSLAMVVILQRDRLRIYSRLKRV